MSYGGFEYNQPSEAMGFGGFDAMNGGGFMNSQGASKTDSARKTGRGDRSIKPVTVKQVLSAIPTNDGFTIDETAVHQVRLVGIIENIEDSSTTLNYTINDATGSCECKFWKDNDVERFSHIRPSDFVRVEGQLREYEGKKSIHIYVIKKVEDWDEMTHHYLDTIYVHLQQTKGPLPKSNASGKSGGFSTPSHNSFMQPSFGGGNGNSLQLNDEGNDVRLKLWNAFKTLDTGSVEGVNVEMAFNAVAREGYSRQDLKTALASLADDGNLYSTVDEEHYKSTE